MNGLLSEYGSLFGPLLNPPGTVPRMHVNPRPKNIPIYRNSDLAYILCHSAPTRGAYASSRTWGGMRWTGMGLLTSGPFADGEVVWSWRAHARAKSAAMLTHCGLRRWQELVHRGERV